MFVQKCANAAEFKSQISDLYEGFERGEIGKVGVVNGTATLATRAMTYLEIFLARFFRWKGESIRKDTVAHTLQNFIILNEEFLHELTENERIKVLSCKLVVHHFASSLFAAIGVATKNASDNVKEHQFMLQSLTDKTKVLEARLEKLQTFADGEVIATVKEAKEKLKKVDELLTKKVMSLPIKEQSPQKKSFSSMRNNLQYSDIVLVGADDKKVHAHRVFLTDVSFFSNKTLPIMRKNSSALEVDVSVWDIEAINLFLDYQYGLGLSNATLGSLTQLYEFADFLVLPELKKEVIELLLKNLDTLSSDALLPDLFDWIEKGQWVPDLKTTMYMFYLLPRLSKTTLRTLVEILQRSDTQPNLAFKRVALGLCYEKGLGVAQDINKAVELYRLAAEQGYAPAQSNLGLCYMLGRGVAQDINKAVELYRSAAEQGFAPAQHRLATCYEAGRGVAQDINKAVELYRSAAEQGFAPAQSNLGHLYMVGTVVKDFKKGVELYRLAAEQDHAPAQFNLGRCYEDKRGVEKDTTKAVELFILAAEQGEENAQCCLGMCYQYGMYGIAVDLNKAAELYRLSAAKGVEEAKRQLAEMNLA